MTERNEIVTNASKVRLYDNTTLQMLDRWIPDKERGHFFTTEAFIQSIDSWKGVPLVYAQEHPDLLTFKNDPKKALSMIKTRTGTEGRIVGNLIDPAILKEGHPRFTGVLPIADKEVQNLWKEGKLSLSTAFLCDVDDATKHISGGIEPNHILLFEENDINQPADKGAIVNQEVVMSDEEKPKTVTQKLREAFLKMAESFADAPPNVEQTPPVIQAAQQSKEEESMDAKLQAEMKNQVDLANKERDDLKATVANLEKTIKDKDTEMVALKNQVAEIEKAKKDAAFDSFLKQIKPALYNKEEDKAKLRERFDTDPVGLLTGIANMLPDASKETDETGRSAGTRDEVKNTSSTIGDFNPLTGKWTGE